MAMFKSLAVAATLTAALTGVAFAGDTGRVLEPAKGISFAVGSKHAVSYFMSKAGACNLTVLMAESTGLDEVKGAATRIAVSVSPARPARIDTAEGKTLEFACGPAATRMTVRVLDQIAYAPRS
ncbi:MAG: hypothetical protein NW217_11740 [Hyphomicrobiaceae bacterium]|nr:hypothetical protein [Hyphomicrobiaceae bacterium]